MIDVVTLALAKKYTDEYSVIVEPADVEAAVDKYLEEHPVQPTPIDDTLTIAGDAADAKAVGDAIDELKEEIQSLQEEIQSLQEEIQDLRQLIIDTTEEKEVAEGIVDSGTEALTDEEVEESYNDALV